MDTLVLYNKISKIKPQELILPYLKPSAAKVQFNLKELDLHYYENFGAYVSKENIDKFSKTGGSEGKILVI